jgi:uncharacterized membrane protein
LLHCVCVIDEFIPKRFYIDWNTVVVALSVHPTPVGPAKTYSNFNADITLFTKILFWTPFNTLLINGANDEGFYT